MKKKPTLVIDIRHDQTKRRSVRMDLSFLVPWLGAERAVVYAAAIRSAALARRSGSGSYPIRAVLRTWAKMSPGGPRYLADRNNVLLITEEMYDLRMRIYKVMSKAGRTVSTANNQWAGFLCYLKFLVAAGEIPRINYSRQVPSLPKGLHTTSAEEAGAGRGDPTTYPKSFSKESDAFHTGVLVPISISKTSDQYIEEYAVQLRTAINSVKNAALMEVNALREKMEQGEALIKTTDYQAMRDAFESARARGPGRYTDPKNGKHIFSADGGHPNLLGNLLALVASEMNGIPECREIQSKEDGKRVTRLSENGGGHWHFTRRYGKNTLLPYLGILTSRTMVPFFVVLLLEHPNLTVMSLLGARLSNEKGTAFLLNPIDGPTGQVLSIEKPRAVAFKQAHLTEHGREAMNLLIQMTAKVRVELKRLGRSEEAEFLWVGMHMIDYRLLRVSEKQLTTSFRCDPKFSSQTDTARSTRLTTFVESHATLTPWRRTITLKSLRVSAGILSYVIDGEDLARSARSLGHSDVQTTIDHYIPRAFQIALYEHKIRRHQNLLLCLSADGDKEMLRFTDFGTVTVLNEFLESHTASIRERLKVSDSALSPKAESARMSINKNTVIMHGEKHAVAVAILYREHLKDAQAEELMRVDARTGVAPIMWIDLVDALINPLPDALAPLQELVERAKEHANRLRTLIKFPYLA